MHRLIRETSSDAPINTQRLLAYKLPPLSIVRFSLIQVRELTGAIQSEQRMVKVFTPVADDAQSQQAYDKGHEVVGVFPRVDSTGDKVVGHRPHREQDLKEVDGHSSDQCPCGWTHCQAVKRFRPDGHCVHSQQEAGCTTKGNLFCIILY